MIQRKRKNKIQTKNKQYPLTDSCLYKLNSKKRLSELLNTELPILKKISDDSLYHCFIDESGKKPRAIQQPIDALDKVHTRIASLICRIQQPEYIHSGKKRRSHVTNAKEHIGKHRVLTSDIQKFFPSTTKKMVFDFFYKRMKCSSDVSALIADICTYNNFIPTGSRISMPMAFWANEPMFIQLYKISEANGVKFTVFVDDIVFSGTTINKIFTYQVKKIVENFGQNLHPKKTKFYRTGETKVITGVAVDDDGLKVANKHRKDISEDLDQWKIASDAGLQQVELNNRLKGKMIAQSLVDPRFKDKVRSWDKSNELISNGKKEEKI